VRQGSAGHGVSGVGLIQWVVWLDRTGKGSRVAMVKPPTLLTLPLWYSVHEDSCTAAEGMTFIQIHVLTAVGC